MSEPVFVEVEGDDAAQAQVAIKREDEALQRLTEVAQLKDMLELEPLRDFLWRLLGRCHAFASTWDANYGKMSFAEGERNIGLWLLHEISEANPDALLAMQTKANRQASENARQQREAAVKRRPRS